MQRQRCLPASKIRHRVDQPVTGGNDGAAEYCGGETLYQKVEPLIRQLSDQLDRRRQQQQQQQQKKNKKATVLKQVKQPSEERCPEATNESNNAGPAEDNKPLSDAGTMRIIPTQFLVEPCQLLLSLKLEAAHPPPPDSADGDCGREQPPVLRLTLAPAVLPPSCYGVDSGASVAASSSLSIREAGDANFASAAAPALVASEESSCATKTRTRKPEAPAVVQPSLFSAAKLPMLMPSCRGQPQQRTIAGKNRPSQQQQQQPNQRKQAIRQPAQAVHPASRRTAACTRSPPSQQPLNYPIVANNKAWIRRNNKRSRLEAAEVEEDEEEEEAEEELAEADDQEPEEAKEMAIRRVNGPRLHFDTSCSNINYQRNRAVAAAAAAASAHKAAVDDEGNSSCGDGDSYSTGHLTGDRLEATTSCSGQSA